MRGLISRFRAYRARRKRVRELRRELREVHPDDRAAYLEARARAASPWES
jgi:hypothetical protein